MATAESFVAVVSRHVAVADDVAQVGGAFVQHEEVLERFFGIARW